MFIILRKEKSKIREQNHFSEEETTPKPPVKAWLSKSQIKEVQHHKSRLALWLCPEQETQLFPLG